MQSVSPSNTQDWGPFGRPLFQDEDARALSRVGVVDVGSNSVRLVVFDGAARSPAYFYNEKIMCGLGAGLSESGRLNPEGKIRAFNAIKRFAALREWLDLPPLSAVATAAVRDAEDGPEFAAQIEAETGIKLYVIDGKEEARFSAQGVLLGWPGSFGLVCDIGGSSMELALLDDGQVGARGTSQLGPLKLKDFTKKSDKKQFISDEISRLFEEIGAPRKQRLFLVGGSWRAFARVDMERRGYPLKVLHEYRLTTKDITDTAQYIRISNLEDLRQRCGISSDRMALLPDAADVLRKLIKTLTPKDITISAYGIREGLLYEQMPRKLQMRDPLIEACRFAEAKDARLPGFGSTLYKFVIPLFPKADWQRKRLIKAACLLHDVTWRAHPDYRDELAFDNATRANLGGLKHAERVYLGLALLHRYSNKREGSRFEPLFDLLDPQSQAQAEVLGKAMRLGAMLAIRPKTLPAELLWNPKKRKLTLDLQPSMHDLFGEVAQARLDNLAKVLIAEAEVRFLDAE